jgi:mitochondrial enoyl-[acyl-carrier protein] reductase / trans-2-enoyl-CoA reductase
MKRIQLSSYGTPEEVAQCIDAAALGAPGAHEAIFDVLAFPINPADIWFCKGAYRLKPPLPAVPGAECVGRITAVGSAVKHLHPGQLVINLQRENWAQQRRVAADQLVAVAQNLDVQQAAMLRINPPTASLLLSDLVKLAPGDWVIQNVANSAVGRWVISLAKRRGLRTVNIVRRESLFSELTALGADVCLVDGPSLAARVREATANASIRLGLDAVAGAASVRLAECLSDEGVVCCYGSMSGADPQADRSALIYRGISLTGFMLGRFLAKRTPSQITSIYAELADELGAGKLSVPVAATYPIDQIAAALRHAQQGERGGKILVLPNG